MGDKRTYSNKNTVGYAKGLFNCHQKICDNSIQVQESDYKSAQGSIYDAGE